jgi:hypothetical protein
MHRYRTLTASDTKNVGILTACRWSEDENKARVMEHTQYADADCETVYQHNAN